MEQKRQTPLKNIRVLDLSRILAGPWCTKMLADMGAEVIKIESAEGDDTRRWGPPFVGEDQSAAYFHCCNRNKKSIVIDFTTQVGIAQIHQLAKISDIVVENFKWGGLKKYQLDYDSLKKINPKLIYCSITGFGQTGPWAPRAGYDYIIQGLSGVMALCGEPEGRAQKLPVAFADIFTGIYACNAILAALYERVQSGQGCFIDAALMDSMLAVMANMATSYFATGETPQRTGTAHPNISPYQTFPSADHEFILAIGNDNQFQKFMDIIGLGHLAKDERFIDNRARIKNRPALTAIMEEQTKKIPSHDILAQCEIANVPAGPILPLKEAMNLEQVKARGLISQAQLPDGFTMQYCNFPIQFTQIPIITSGRAPKLDEHRAEILKMIP